MSAEEAVIAEVMGEYSVSYAELDGHWPWRQVMQFYERIVERNFVRAYPHYEAMALTINMNRRKGAEAVTAVSIMPDFLLPERLRDPNRGVAKYSALLVEAFEHALKHGHVSNGLLAALDVRDLRASGAVF